MVFSLLINVVVALNKKQRKRHEKKMATRMANVPVEIPVHKQAVDITPASYYSYNRDEPSAVSMVEATENEEKRAEITKSAREARREEIKEANFLRGL